MLELNDLKICYNQAVAVHGINLRVDKGELVVIAGPNGAGKTSIMMAISGVVQPESGRIVFHGEDITYVASHHIYSRGIVQVPEGRMIFGELTVRDNLLIAADTHKKRKGSTSDLQKVFGFFPVLGECANQRADLLSGGQLQILAIARGLMGRPKLLMLDEPSLGLAPLVVKKLFEIIRTLKEEGLTILLVEQNIRQALEVADRAYLLQAGRLVGSGKATELLHGDLIVQSYLGNGSKSSTSVDSSEFTSEHIASPTKTTM